VDREEQSLKLQRDVNCLSKWADEWLMEFNKQKCVEVHYRSNNQNMTTSLAHLTTAINFLGLAKREI
jgi:hypothetical protein